MFPEGLDRETKRKLFHLFGLWIPLAYMLTDKAGMLSFIIPLTLLVIGVDYARLHHAPFTRVFNMLFHSILRPQELMRGQKLGASFFLSGCSLSILLFSKPVAISAMCVLLVSDTAAALVGKRWGKHKLGTKSLEGTLAFMATAVVVIFIVAAVSGQGMLFYLGGALAAIISAFVELYSKQMKVDDNLLIPLSVGLILAPFTVW